jgi:uncharacterized protein YhaN
VAHLERWVKKMKRTITSAKESSVTLTAQLRKNIRELLQLLASEDAQLAYERDVRHVDITAELVCMWFDDQYHPDSPHFAAAFSLHELAVLAEFHQFYDSRVNRLPESAGTVRTWLACPLWREIMAQAQRTFEKTPNPAARANGFDKLTTGGE